MKPLAKKQKRRGKSKLVSARLLAAACVILVVIGLASWLRVRSAGGADAVIVAVGDIACDPADANYNGGAGIATGCHMGATSDRALALNPQQVLVLGDNQYEDGTLAKYQASYDPSWGRLKALTKPVPGNHEYNLPGATGYFDYFGAAAGGRSAGYYSYDVGSWHVVALNSNCASIGGCQAGSAQESWLRADLGAHGQACTLAYWHHPRFSSGEHGNAAEVQPLWQALYDAKADVVLSGHDHDYERFIPQRPDGTADSGGLAEFVVGSGGKNHYAFSAVKPNSVFRDAANFGVLKLTLHSSSYDWQFVSEGGSVLDSGTAACVTAPSSGSSSSATSSQTGSSAKRPTTTNSSSAPAGEAKPAAPQTAADPLASSVEKSKGQTITPGKPRTEPKSSNSVWSWFDRIFSAVREYLLNLFRIGV